MLHVSVAVALLSSIIWLAISLYRKFPAVGSKLLFIQTLLVFFWFLMDVLILFGYKPTFILEMHNMKFLSIVATPVLLLLITLKYTNNTFLLKKVNTLYLWIIPTITMIMIALNQSYGLVWAKVEVIQIESYYTVMSQQAPMFWVHAAYSYLLILLSLVLLFNKFLKSPPIYRRQSGFLLFGCIVTWLLNILFVWSNTTHLIDPTPLSSLMILWVFYWGLYKYGAQRIVPIVRDLIVENMEDMILVLDNSDLIIEMNPSLKKNLKNKLGITTNFIGSTLSTLLSNIPNWSDKFINYSGKINLALGDGEKATYYEIERTTVLDKDQHKIGSLIVLHDITNMQKVMKKLEYMTSFDQLTGLYNRAFFEIELERLDTARQLPISFIVGDVNGLKMTNDAFGHAVGDRLLQKVSEIIRGAMRSEDISARTGGDEFCIILPKTNEQEARKIIDRINKSCEQSPEKPIKVSVSWGQASKISASQDIQQVLKEADAGMYKKKLLETKSTHGEIVASLINTLKESSFETNEHAERMKSMAFQLGIELHLSDSQMDDLLLLALLHDLGKVGVPNSILEKPSKLMEEEWEMMKRHTEIGYHIASSSNDLSHIADAILSHHEHWDGNGYPRKLKGREIPYLARIISVIDSYDVMTHARVYKQPISRSAALVELRRCSGTQFDPEITLAFCHLLDVTPLADIGHHKVLSINPSVSVTPN